MKKTIVPFCLFFAGMLSAQEATDSISSKYINEVEIIGTKPVIATRSEYVGKLPLRNLENAQVYTGITSTLITQQKIYNMDDVVRNAPGISKGSDGWAGSIMYGGATYVSRGFSTEIKALNGLANNITMPSDVQNVSAIEVIKGPSATLFGSIITSYGGLINRVTKKPYADYSLGVDASAGSFGFSRIGIDANLPVNKNKTLLSRTNIAVSKQGSFTDNGGYTKNLLIAPSFAYQLNDKVKISLASEFNAIEVGGMGSRTMFTLTPNAVKQYVAQILQGAGTPAAYINSIVGKMPTTIQEGFGTENIKDFGFDRNTSFYNKNLVSSGQTMSLNATVEYKISDKWKSATSTLYSSGNDNGYEVRMILLPNVVKGVIGALLSGNFANIDYGTPEADYMGRTTRKFETSVNTHQIQQNFVGDFKIGGKRNRMVIGLDYYYHNNQSYWRTFQSNKYGSLFGYAYPGIFDVVALQGKNPNYYNFEKNNIDYLFETAQTDANKKPFGGITSIYSTYVNDVLNISNRLLVNAGALVDRFIAKGIYDGTTNSYSGGYNQNAVSPKFGIVYQPILNTLSLFANYQTGFTNRNGTDKNNKLFKPEHSFQFETGLKYALFDGNFTGTLSVYDIRVKDIVRNDPENIDFNMQDGTQKSRGFEAEILGNPFPNFNVMFGYAYNDSKYEKADESVNGLRPTTAGAKNQFNVWLHYHFETYNFLNNFSIGAGGNYVGKTYAMNQAPDGAFVVPAYTLVNAKISYDKSSYSFTLRANNLLNLDIWAGNAGIFPQMPRQIVGSVALKF